MSDNIIQTSFNAGEWSPALNARVDLAKYHSGAALLRNFYVDYRGGASTKPGSRFINQTKSNSTVRLIPFQASTQVSYVLEFGNNYIRFTNNGVPVLELPTNITAITQANPGVITDTGHGYQNGDWVFLSGIGGMTQLNGNYYIVANRTANTFTLTDLNGVAINTTTFGTYTSGGTAQRVYTLTSPYLSGDLAQLKFAQNINTLTLCHPNYPPHILTLITATNWTILPIVFTPTINPPSAGLTGATTLAAGSSSYFYAVTSVDVNGQESNLSTRVNLSGLDMRTNPGTNTISWTAVTGAVSYNVYKQTVGNGVNPPAGQAFGFIGNTTSPSFIDATPGINPDFSQSAPVATNPFSGAGVQSITFTGGTLNYTSVPTLILTAPPAGGVQATASCTLSAYTVGIVSGGFGYLVGDTITVNGGFGAILLVTAVSGPSNTVSGLSILSGGSTNSSTPSNPCVQSSTSGNGHNVQFNLFWQAVNPFITNPGAGYLVAPTVSSSPAGITGTTVLGAGSSGNPTVPSFYQQRSVFAGPVGNPQQLNMSQPGAYTSFNVANPIQADSAIQGTLVSGQLNNIKSILSMPAGLVLFSDRQAWLVNGGSAGSPATALALVANSQAYSGASDLPPIVAVDNILYVQAKGSIVRDLVYNFYTNVYTGADISILSSHLFYGFQLLEWAWAEEPFKVVWAVRNDGILLSLTFLKEQELIAWAHTDTPNGLYKSICTVTEQASFGLVDAIYTSVQRTINGNTVNYIERFVERIFPSGLSSAWCVDAGIQFSGVATLSFQGAQHLAGQTVTGLATDNLGNTTIITPFVMPVSGIFTLPAPALPATGYTRVVVGLAFTAQLQTLALDLGQPTVQGKRKKVSAVTVRVKETLGLFAGRTFGTLTAMKDLVLGNVGTMSNALVTDLQTTDARTIVDPQWDVFGQFCIQQTLPYPATVLGVVPEIEVGDTAK